MRGGPPSKIFLPTTRNFRSGLAFCQTPMLDFSYSIKAVE